MEDKFSHIDKRGAASMVDVSAKANNARVARAAARVRLGVNIVNLLREGAVAKGDVLAAARIAGIQAAKKTSELIPLCHLLPLDKVGVEFEFEPETVVITSTCKCSRQNRRGNGSADGGERRRADDLRYVQKP